MKKITNYRLYEAFESETLSKTLKFIKPESRGNFMSNIETICNSLDFPKSELSDDMFQYLPFKKALFLNSKAEDVPCDATSSRAFPDYAIDGEVCNGGMMKRKWGRSTRSVSCPICGGTGVKPNKESKVKWIKFWFDKDGKYVRTTMTDGKIRTQIGNIPIMGKSSIPTSMPMPNFSKTKDDYDVYTTLSGWEEVVNLSHGTIVWIDLNGRYCVGMIWKSDIDSNTYVIQDMASGNNDGSNDWRQYGSCSWVVSDGGCLNNRRFEVLVKKGESPKDITKKEDVNPYCWNTNFYMNSGDFIAETGNNMETQLKDAHFALVLDYDVFGNKEFKGVSITKKERTESKTGALKFKSDDEIRKENIKKYISHISDRITVSGDLKELPKHIVRLFGWSNAGNYVLTAKNFNNFNIIIILLSDLLKADTDLRKENCLIDIKNILRSTSKSNMDYNDEITRGLQLAYDEFQKTEEDKLYIPILDAYNEINKEIVQLIKKSEIETIEDLDVLYAKLAAIRRTFKESDRFYEFRNLETFINFISRGDNFRYIKRSIYRDSIESVVENMKRFAKMVSKL